MKSFIETQSLSTVERCRLYFASIEADRENFSSFPERTISSHSSQDRAAVAFVLASTLLAWSEDHAEP